MEFNDTFSQHWIKLTQPKLSTWESTNAANNYYLPFQKVSVFHKVKFYNGDLKGYPGSTNPCVITSTFSQATKINEDTIPGRFNMVLVVSNMAPKEGDIQGKKNTVSFVLCLKIANCQIIVWPKCALSLQCPALFNPLYLQTCKSLNIWHTSNYSLPSQLTFTMTIGCTQSSRFLTKMEIILQPSFQFLIYIVVFTYTLTSDPLHLMNGQVALFLIIVIPFMLIHGPVDMHISWYSS